LRGARAETLMITCCGVVKINTVGRQHPKLLLATESAE